jgi:gliding motility associated protien GldN
MSVSQTNAQRVRRRNKPTSAYDTTRAAGNGAAASAYDTTKKITAPQSAYGNPAGANASTAGGDSTKIPIRDAVGGSSNGLLDSTKPSLRNDAAIELNLIKDRTPLEYENIREDDAVYRVRVWREIDIREKINLPFRYAAEEDNGSQRFIAILLGAIKSGQVTAFSGEDDRFTTPITFDDAMKAFGGGTTISNHFDDQGNIDYKVRRARNIDPDSIYKFRLKEEWIFDKETSRMYVRILGIAPVVFRKTTDGSIVPGSEHPVWWVYYPDMRPVLAKYDVYNPKNFGARMTWEDLFEARMFSSYIIKSTLDNPYDQTIAQKYPNSTLFRLLEGEKIKDKIFDYEQSLWSY